MGTGSYKISEFSMEAGDLITNGDFSSWNGAAQPNDFPTGWTVSGNDATNYFEDATNAARVISDGTLVYMHQAILTVGKRYRYSINVTDVTSGSIIITSGSVSASISATVGIITTTGIHTFEHTAAIGANVYIRRNTGATDVTFTNVKVTEIPPLQGMDTGTKFLENTSAGTIATQSEQAYGTWIFDIYKGGDENVNFINFISNSTTPIPSRYVLYFSGTESIVLVSNVTQLFQTATSYITIDTWYRMKITRTTAGVFTVYIRGGAFGDDSWTTVVADSGTNPVTDNTYTTSAYTVLDLDAGDKITNLKYSKGIRQ